MRQNRKTYLWIFLVLFLVSLMEGLSQTGLYLLRKYRNTTYQPTTVSLSENHKKILSDFIEGKTEYIRYDRQLGWSIKTNGNFGLYHANSQGIRGNLEYASNPPSDRIRIASFGDSFTHGDEVKNKDTWQSYIEKLKSNIEVLNFGVGAYGLDQAYLRYRLKGKDFHPNIVFIGYMTENFARNVSVFRPFYYPDTKAPLSKPRFILDDDKLVKIENPVSSLGKYKELLNNPQKNLKRLGTHDYYFQAGYNKGLLDILPSIRLFKILRKEFFVKKNYEGSFYNEKSEAFRVTLRIFDAFNNDVIKNNSLPIVLIFPNVNNMNIFAEEQVRVYQPLLDYFDKRGILYIDILNAFIKGNTPLPNNYLFLKRGHYSPLANRQLANYILQRLKREGLDNVDKLEKNIKELMP